MKKTVLGTRKKKFEPELAVILKPVLIYDTAVNSAYGF